MIPQREYGSRGRRDSRGRSVHREREGSRSILQLVLAQPVPYNAPSITHQMSKRALIFSLGFTGLLLLLGYYKYDSDMTAWTKVRESLNRLLSGIQFEPIIMLRSKLADADAAISWYQSAGRIFPLDHAVHIQNAKRGLSYLDISIDGAKSIHSWEEMERSYRDVTKWIPRTCYGERLYFDREYIKGGFAVAGTMLIREAAGSPPPDLKAYEPLDLQKESSECQKAHREKAKVEADRRAREAAAHQGKWRYHVLIDNPDYCLMDVTADGQIVFVSSEVERRIHVDAQNDVSLSDVFCIGSPGRSLRIEVNGKLVTPKWQEDTYRRHTAVIAPPN